MERREMVLKGTDNHPHPLTFCISGGNTKCGLCGNNIDERSWFYFCDECSLRLHLRCGDQLEFPNKNRQEMETREKVNKGICIRNNHQHPLGVYFCKGYHQCGLCCNVIDEGLRFYYCSKCFYRLHLYCGDFLEFVILPSDLHPLKLLRVVDNIICHYCEKSDQNTLMYTYDNCSIHIHPKCLVIPLPTISVDNKNHSQYTCHDRPMSLVKHDGKCDRVVRHCLACQSPWSSDLAYTCQKSCENVLHKACAELPQKIECPSYHPYHSLKLQFCESHQSCSACFKRGGKLMYFCCDQGCNFILGTECAFLAPTMTWDRDDDHFLFLIERANYDSDQNCYFCHNSYEKLLVKDHDEVIHTQSFLFRCFECDFNIHFLCGPFPSIIKHECHVHSLSLEDYIADDDDSEDKDSNDYYCDVCEEKRNPLRFRVYYCAKCKYVAHIHCVISEVIKVLQGDLTNVELLSVGDKRWKNTNEEEEEEHLVNKEEAGMSIQTLRDLMESLTYAERKQLLNPLGDSSTGLKALHEKAREENSRRYERKDDGEDIHRIQNLFNITSSDIQNSYLDEFRCFNSEEGLKFDERHLKMKVVDVEGYKVPRSLAPVLQTLLRQNGDFVRKSRLRPEMKSIACTFVCILVERMSMTKPEDITKDLLKHWVFYYNSIRTITDWDSNNFLVDKLKRLFESFLGYEAIKFKKEMAERLPKQITELQLQLETSKANLEKLKGIGDSTTSDLMKGCLRRSSEFKRKGCW